MFRLLLIAATIVLAGCYSERLAPPAYRYSCGGDGDCTDPERCIEGLCQVACTQATFGDDCPADGGFVVCLNGICSSTCPADDNACPNPQECFTLDIEVPSGGFFGGGTATEVGVCGVMCTEDSCPGSEICLQGFCVATCPTPDVACPNDLVCIGGLCVPDPGDDGGSSATGAGGATETGGGSTGTGGTM